MSLVETTTATGDIMVNDNKGSDFLNPFVVEETTTSEQEGSSRRQ